MGGCASKPKAQEGPNPEALPAENRPAAPEQTARPVEGDAPAEAKTDNAEESKEKPLADLSEPEPEESTAAAGQELAPGISELNVEAPVESVEPKQEDHEVPEKAEEIVDEETKEEATKTEKKEATQTKAESSQYSGGVL